MNTEVEWSVLGLDFCAVIERGGKGDLIGVF